MISEEEFTEAVKVIGDEKKKGKSRDELVEMLSGAKYTDMDIKKIMGEVYKEQATKKKKEEKEKLFDLDEYYKYKKEDNILFKSSSVEALEDKKIDFKKLDFLSRYWMIFSGQLPAKALVDEKTNALNTILVVSVVSFIQNFAWFLYAIIVAILLIIFYPPIGGPFLALLFNEATTIQLIISTVINLVGLLVSAAVSAVISIILGLIAGLLFSLLIFALARLFGGEGKYIPYYLRFLKMMAVICFGIVIISPLILFAGFIVAWLVMTFGGLGFGIAQGIFAILALAIAFIALRLHVRMIQAYFSIEKFSAIAVMIISLIIWVGLIIAVSFIIFLLFGAILASLIPFAF